MKVLPKLLLALLPLVSVAQYSTENLHVINTNRLRDEITPDSLSRQLTENYKTDREKVTSIFRWITENISYNLRPFYKDNNNDYLIDETEDTGALKPLSERVAIDVLRKRVAFCDGYARLFKTLCDYAGIKSEIVTGYADGSMGRRQIRFGSNHRWNAVYLDSTWQLLDATWASGHLTYGSNSFVQSYNNYYFLTHAKDFAHDHYPEDLRWSLLNEPPFMTEFRFSPFKAHAFLKNNIRSYKPEAGVLEASLGDTLRFEVETSGDKNRFLVLDTTFVDSAVIADAATDIFKNTSTIAGDKVKYKYIVSATDDKWLNVVMNDEVIMRYKLHVRKNDTVAR